MVPNKCDEVTCELIVALVLLLFKGTFDCGDKFAEGSIISFGIDGPTFSWKLIDESEDKDEDDDEVIGVLFIVDDSEHDDGDDDEAVDDDDDLYGRRVNCVDDWDKLMLVFVGNKGLQFKPLIVVGVKVEPKIEVKGKLLLRQFSRE